MQPLGQEGDVLSPAYDALLARWATGAYMPMTTADDAAAGVVTLAPA
jgi:acyl-homoserine lactone acylase PvdQ